MEATELLKEIQKHDSQQAFRSLYDMYYDRFFRIAFYYLQRDEWAQEVILDVFTTLWNHRKSQLIPDDFNKYSYILIRNAALNYLEKNKGGKPRLWKICRKYLLPTFLLKNK